MGGKLRQNGLHLLHVSVRHFGADFFFEKKTAPKWPASSARVRAQGNIDTDLLPLLTLY
jgi:hypothetical protein